MDFKGYRLWVMGQLDSTCSAPPRQLLRLVVDEAFQHVAVQVGFDPEAQRLETETNQFSTSQAQQGLKPGGASGRYGSTGWVNLYTAPPG
jgi:hypothetical protein